MSAAVGSYAHSRSHIYRNLPTDRWSSVAICVRSRQVIFLSFVLALGFLLVILSCALWSNWLPLVVGESDCCSITMFLQGCIRAYVNASERIDMHACCAKSRSRGTAVEDSRPLPKHVVSLSLFSCHSSEQAQVTTRTTLSEEGTLLWLLADRRERAPARSSVNPARPPHAFTHLDGFHQLHFHRLIDTSFLSV